MRFRQWRNISLQYREWPLSKTGSNPGCHKKGELTGKDSKAQPAGKCLSIIGVRRNKTGRKKKMKTQFKKKRAGVHRHIRSREKSKTVKQ